MTRLRTQAKLVALGVSAVLLALVLAEGVLGVMAPQRYEIPRIWEFDQMLGWRHIPEATGWLRTPEFRVEYIIDEDGRRVSSKARRDVPAASRETPRIAVFGDSFAEGWGVNAGETMSSQLEVRLRQDGGTAWVSNFGVAGYGTDQQLLMYSRMRKKLTADIVLVLFYGNDLWNNASRHGIGDQRGDKPFFTLDTAGILRLEGVPVRRAGGWDREPGFWDRLVSRSHAAALIAGAMVRPEVASDGQSSYYRGLYGDHTPEHWQLTCRLLSRFQQMVEADGRRFAVIYAPAIVQIDSAHWRQKRDRFHLGHEFEMTVPNRMLSVWATEQGAAFLDLTPAFLGSNGGPKALYFSDSHWRPAGHQLAAVETHRFLGTMGWIEESKTGSRPP